MAIIIKCWRHGSEGTPGRWLKSFDPEANGGHGEIVLTDDRNEALQVENTLEAMRLMMTVPKCHPVRLTDGQPNRPLRAYTTLFVHHNKPGNDNERR